MIRTNYDPQADVLHIAFGPEGGISDTSEEVAPGVFVEYGLDGQPIGVEIISVQRRAGTRDVVPAAA